MGNDLTWIDGAPKGFYAQEWFLAKLKDGTHTTLIGLPIGQTYDYKDRDGTYYTESWVVSWKQSPDSQYVAPEKGNKIRMTDRFTEDHIVSWVKV